MDLILKYFPNINSVQKQQFTLLQELYQDWNLKINVVSRKDIEELYLRHVLHSLAIAKLISFNKGAQILDVGTGGGFPGIPLAILFPDTHFTLVDSIGKKIKVVNEVTKGLNLINITTKHMRVEDLNNQYDFIISRAVAHMNTFTHWTQGKVKKKSNHKLANGILYLKGGDLKNELKLSQKQRFIISLIFLRKIFLKQRN
jgi:16S rRNA (guanine527-N7)-methyltransferase